MALLLTQIDDDEWNLVFQPPFGGLPEATRYAGGAVTFFRVSCFGFRIWFRLARVGFLVNMTTTAL